METKFRHIVAISLVVVALLASAGSASVNIVLKPEFQVVRNGDTIALEVHTISNTSATESVSALDAVLTYDPARLFLTDYRTDPSAYNWFYNGFMWPSPDNVNGDIGDGQAMFSAWAQPGSPAYVGPDGLYVTTLLMVADNLTTCTYVRVPTSAGSAKTRVFSGAVANADIKGTTGSARIMIVPEGTSLSTSDPRQAPDGTAVSLAGPVVTKTFASYFYIEDMGRASGLRVDCSADLMPAEGTVSLMSGTMTTVDGERVLVLSSRGEANNVDPLGSLIVTGKDTQSGLSAVGLLVRMVGRVRAVSVNGGSFFIDDGSHSQTPVELHGVSAPAVGSFVGVTGVLGGTQASPIVRVNSASDITVY